MAGSTGARKSGGEWLFQLTTITLGVLIALSFDAALRWNTDRRLVAEAKATIQQEIADNRRHMEGHVAELPRRIEQLETAQQLLDDLLAERESSVHEVQIGLTLPELTSAGWETAERTGALALMDYADVQRLAKLYGFQGLFVSEFQRILEPLAQVEVYFRKGPPVTHDDLQTARIAIVELRGKLSLHEQLARQLGEAYATYRTEAAAAASSR
jgi:hypothetical protein